jgi:hypothetical protein
MRRFISEPPQKKAREKAPAVSKEQSAVTALRRFRPPLRVNVALENCQPVRVASQKRKMSKATCFGRPAPGALPAIGGNGKPGPATSGTSPYKVKKLFLFTASCTTCSVAAGWWKERMTEFFTTEALRHGEVIEL